MLILKSCIMWAIQQHVPHKKHDNIIKNKPYVVYIYTHDALLREGELIWTALKQNICKTIHKLCLQSPKRFYKAQSLTGGTSTLVYSAVTLCVFPSFEERMTRRDSEKQTEGRGYVSVPLRVPRPGQNVGKVAQCLSHDPLLPSGSMDGDEMSQRNQHSHTFQHTVLVTAGGQRLALTVC